MAAPDRNDGEKQKAAPAAFNLKLIGFTLLNQIILGVTIWTGGPGYERLSTSAHFDVAAVLLGVFAGLAPLVYISRLVEESESPYFAGLNLSTNMAVLRLFGPEPRPVLAFLASALMAGVTGVVEETLFRGQLIPALSNSFLAPEGGDLLTGVFLSTFLFAFLHTNPLAFFRPSSPEAFVDNVVLLLFQFVSGSVFAALYLATGNLAVPIVAHGCYDFYTFYKTHLVDVAGQMSYAAKSASSSSQSLPSFSSRAVEQKWTRLRGEGFVTSAKQTFYLMDADRDGTLSRKELRVALFSYGINLSSGQSQEVLLRTDRDDSGTIDFDEFLEFVGPTGSTTNAVRNTLFGPI